MEALTKSDRDIKKAAAIVRDGGVIAFPTDTTYGLGCDPHNVRALRRLSSAKGKRAKPIPVLVSSPKLARRISVMNSKARDLTSHFWPGPLTLVVKSRVRFPNLLTKRRKTIAVRCPGNQLTLKLIRSCGGFLTGTSANIAGKPPCKSAEMVRRVFDGRIDAIIDGGSSPRRRASTIVRVNTKGVTILRKGPIGSLQIRRTLSCVPQIAREKAQQQQPATQTGSCAATVRRRRAC